MDKVVTLIDTLFDNSDMCNAIVTHFPDRGIAFSQYFLAQPHLSVLALSRKGSLEVTLECLILGMGAVFDVGLQYAIPGSNPQPQTIQSFSHPVAGLQAWATKPG